MPKHDNNLTVEERECYEVVDTTKKGWKVCLSKEGRHFSCWTMRGQEEYVVGVETVRRDKFGPLAVFRSRLDACAFVTSIKSKFPERYFSFTVWSCEYLPSTDHHLWVPSMVGRQTAYSLPEGTVFAEKVMLVAMAGT